MDAFVHLLKNFYGLPLSQLKKNTEKVLRVGSKT